MQHHHIDHNTATTLTTTLLTTPMATDRGRRSAANDTH
jgi:hypothetical protein